MGVFRMFLLYSALCGLSKHRYVAGVNNRIYTNVLVWALIIRYIHIVKLAGDSVFIVFDEYLK